MAGVDRQQGAALLRLLEDSGYDFVTTTPATHARVLDRRRGELARDLRDVFGWSMPFGRELLDGALFALLRDADLLDERNGQLRSRVRVSSLAGRLFLHSAFPTSGKDAVFFGPDTYRFVRFVESALQDDRTIGRLVDLGAGGGAGGIVAAELTGAAETLLVDTNPAALAMAEANALAVGAEVRPVCADGLREVEGDFDLVVANPPYIMDTGDRTYRDGGEMLGAELSVRWAREAAGRLSAGGRMLLYTGSAVVAGGDALLSALAEVAEEAQCSLRYEELDPDVFGEELDQPPYREAQVERIAAVGAVLSKD